MTKQTTGKRRLRIPPWLHATCTQCGLCCRRGWVIHVSAKDRERLLAHDWAASYPQMADQDLIVASGHAYRFAVDGQGRCRFLRPDGLCMQHTDLGYKAKVLACRLYPVYFVHTTGGEVRVGAHFSCPAVVDAAGPPLHTARSQLLPLLDQYEAEHPLRPIDPAGVRWTAERTIPWEVLDQVEAALDDCFARSEVPVIRRVLFGGHLVDALDERLPAPGQRTDFAECVRFARKRAEDLAFHGGLKRVQLGRTERLFLRLLVGLGSEMAVQGLLSELFWTRQRARLRRLGLAAGYLWGRGAFTAGGRRGPWRGVKRVRAHPLPEEAEEPLTRYLRTRFAARAYFGQEGWGLGVLHGARVVLSLYAVTVYLARMLCAAESEERGAEAPTSVSDGHVREALMLVDHAFGHMASLSLGPVRRVIASVNRPGWAQRAALYASL